MFDLNDLYLFATVVEHKGYAGAARALRISKSKLSRRIGALQAQLGVPLLQLSTRHFSLTQSGAEFYLHAKAVVIEAEAAQESIEMLRSEPQGTIRLVSPIVLAHAYLTDLLPEFLRTYPKVRVVLEVTTRVVDLSEERFDVAFRVTPEIRDESDMMVRILARGRTLLVASPDYLNSHLRPIHPRQLERMDILGSVQEEGEEGLQWTLKGPDGQVESIRIAPRLLCRDVPVAMAAALSGIGIAQIPEPLCASQISNGQLEHILPDWGFPEGIVHLVYPARRSQLPSVRAFLDFMTKRVQTRATP
jgi:DNA-binding transcriptional LysR family regulator